MTTESKNFRAWFQNNRLLWGGMLVVAFSLMRFIETAIWRQWFGSLDFQESPLFALFLLLWFVLMSMGLIAGGIVWLTKTSWQELGWVRKGVLKSIGLGVVGFILLYINIIVWAMLKGNTAQPEMFTPSPARLLLVMFFAFGLPAWVEENLYRGYLQPLLAEKMSVWPAVIVQAVIFSAAHLGYLSHPLDFGSAFVTGIILGLLRKRGTSLIAPFVAHGLFWMMGAFMVIPS
ncbi:MAG: CPBP family intramembrane metalloprotease [Anaerolineaceae bacterium]|nr:CPBP family intramembrane metalloprotease [Anaerolineaceae bacterium]